MIRKIILILTGILACSLSLAYSNYKTIMPKDDVIVPVDGTIYKLIPPTYIEFKIDLIKNSSNTYDVKPYTCELKTPYPTDTGISYTGQPNHFEGPYYSNGIIHNRMNVFLKIYGTSYTLPFYTPNYAFFNHGCSTYLDGDKCTAAHTNGTDVLYIRCTYDV